MAREDWREREADREFRRRQTGREDFGQADYSTQYGYDPERRTGYRSEEGPRGREDYGAPDYSDYVYDPAARRYDAGEPGPRPEPASRSWADRASGLFGGRPREADPRPAETAPRRRGPSDRVLWAVIMERLDNARGVDLRNIDVTVVDGEVTLTGTVRHKSDKRRIEDIVDIEGVRYVQNNLRPHETDRRWTFL